MLRSMVGDAHFNHKKLLKFFDNNKIKYSDTIYEQKTIIIINIHHRHY